MSAVGTWARAFGTGLLGRARALLHGLGPKGEHPSRGDNGCSCRWCVYDAVFDRRIRWVLPWDRQFFDDLKEDWEATHHECSRLEMMLAGDE